MVEESFRSLIWSILETQPDYVLTWFSIIRSQDPVLRAKLSDFLVQKQYIKNPKQFVNWIESVADSFKQGQVIGSTEAANFRAWLLEFVKTTEGWQAIRNRLANESVSIPFELRNAMALILSSQENRFWKMYGMATARSGPSVATLLPNLEKMVVSTELSRFMLEEVGMRNMTAADTIDPVWTELLASGAPMWKSMLQTILDGSTLSDLYRFLAVGFSTVIAEPATWDRVKSLAYSHMRMRPESAEQDVKNALLTQIQQQGTDALPFIKTTIEQFPDIEETWRARSINSIRFLGEAPVVADFLINTPQLQPEWDKVVGRMIVFEPSLMRNMLEALVARRVGDSEWNQTIQNAKRTFFMVILRDRILFEQLIAGRNQDFKVKLEEALGL